jgi:hypothetical protein
MRGPFYKGPRVPGFKGPSEKHFVKNRVLRLFT